MNTNEQIYQRYLNDLKGKIIQRYESSGRRASGKFSDEIHTETSETKMTLYGAEHSVFVEKGRRSGAFPPRKAIIEWIEVKQGLPPIFKEKKEQFAFLIARKIAEQGTQGSNILESIIQEWVSNTMPKMLNELGAKYLIQIENDIVGLLKQLK